MLFSEFVFANSSDSIEEISNYTDLIDMSSLLPLNKIRNGFPSPPDEHWISYRIHIERIPSLESPDVHISDKS